LRGKGEGMITHLKYPLSETPGIRGQDPEGKYAFYGLFSPFPLSISIPKTP
jgi:hypothetical protein